VRRVVLAVLIVAALPAAAGAQSGSWRQAAAVPDPRSEVAAALVNGQIAMVGGFSRTGGNSRRVDSFSPKTNRWRRLPDLPLAVDHSTAAAFRGVLYVAGGYRSDRAPSREAFAFRDGSWRRLPRMPSPRAAAGAAFSRGKLYVMGGVGPSGLARSALEYDPAKRRWRTITGPTPREHLGVTSARGRVFVVAGRTAGFDTNLDTVEAYSPATGRWATLPPVPGRRGGTSATATGRYVVSVGGEANEGTIEEVYALDLNDNRWRRLPDLPTPRHGLGVVYANGRVYVLAGGPTPGLSVSPANEFIALR
jgi:N-acetylneuraminic acid mutarotase